jgi:hypothetical protein
MKYWCRQILILTVNAGPRGPQRIVVPRPFAIVGSDPRADLPLDDPQAPARALYIHATDNGVYYRVLEMNVGSIPSSKFMRLSPTDELQVGDTRFQVQAEASSQQLWEPGQPHHEGTPIPVFQVHAGNAPVVTKRLYFAFQTVGSHPQCEIHLDSPTVSPSHALLFWYQHHLWLIDFCSTIGTLVGGQRVACAELKVGDVLEIGTYVLKFDRLTQRKQLGKGAEAPTPLAPSPSSPLPPPAATLPAPAPPAAVEPATPAVAPPDMATLMSESASQPASFVPAAEFAGAAELLVSNVIGQPQPSLVPGFEPIQIQYGFTAPPVLQLETTPLGEALSGRCDSLQAEQTALREQWEQFTREMRSWQERAFAESQQRAADQTAAEILRLQEERTQLFAELAAAREALARSAEETRLLREEVSSRNAAWDQQQSTAADLIQRREEETGQLLEQLRSELAAATAERDRLQAERDTQTSALQTLVAGWTERLDEATQQRDALHSRGAAFADELAQAAVALRTAQEQLHTERAALAATRETWQTTEQAWAASWNAQWQATQAAWQEEQQRLTEAWSQQLRIVEHTASELAPLQAQLAAESQRLLTTQSETEQKHDALFAACTQLQRELAENGSEIERQWREELARVAEERADWRKEIARVSEDRQQWRALLSQLEAKYEQTVTDLTLHVTGERQHLAQGFHEAQTLWQEQAATWREQLLAEQQRYQQELAARALEGNWREAWDDLQREWLESRSALENLRSEVNALLQQSHEERTEVKTQWQVIATDMEQLSLAMKRKWKDLLRRQQASVAQAEEHARRMAELEQQSGTRQGQLDQLQEQVVAQHALVGEERERFRRQWGTLAHGLARLGQAFAAESAPQLEQHATPAKSETASLDQLTLYEDQATAADTQERLLALRAELDERQRTGQEMQATLARELEQFGKEREATRQQWGQMAESLNRLTRHYRDQAKRLKEERKLMTAEHERITHEKNIALEQLARQATQVATLQQELEQIRAVWQEQLPSLAD